ncbi:ATP-binding cassette domain-containing protein [Gordonia amarae]|uniref:ABC-type quaternary amine transporter n=2 Tax=Gordonia amarae TaxID=36821 RepID=G7GV91_9ACTN|nr:ABC transporter ATP-binding protein [Gordonia amarae]MCS3879972.1 thiamine transport system ATP-binding protein [Gordonia amarae]QHN18365.1 ATP-binding cassette domain-containing protein [Gordonia amarae]QHN22847.1 ATP-binding cassette domain-containing protein [Gordonia amarae]QHN31751.1 ATP-binding cassette domain-containing protein [Gordonia amarae]QHN40496.1 ATP-binding cassette domain-containing protein [Gordonia amarae]
MLEIDTITVRYGADVVIDGLSWSVGPQAPVAALLGPSGCGKSTLLRAVAGLEPLVAGTIGFDGQDLARVPAHRRDFGVVFQDGQLFDGRSVAANVAYGLKMRRWGRREIAARVEEMLELVGLAGYGGRSVREISGGQAQRVALARALAPRPRLLLLDEPLAALDKLLRDRLAVDIAEIVRETSTPTVIVTHDHTEAALMADRVSVMRDGQIVQTDTSARLWLRPVDEEAARFLGVTTVLDATVAGDVADCVLGRVAVDVPDGRVRLGLRPESVVVEPLSHDIGNGSVTGRVLHAAVLPGGVRLDVRPDLPGEIGVIAATAPSDGIVAGATVRLRLHAGRVAVLGQRAGRESGAGVPR